MVFHQIHNFLTSEEHRCLLDSILQSEDKFCPATVSTNEADYRRSKVMYQLPNIDMGAKIIPLVPVLTHLFRLPPFKVGQFECQTTAHTNGDYFKTHNDNGSPNCANRKISYVYYFFNTPKPFTGGELRLHTTPIVNFTPVDNCIVFFPSDYLHEVLPIWNYGRFIDSRFTVNGWVRSDP